MATIAAIIGDNLGLWIGDKGGCRLLRRYGHYVRADDTKIKTGRLIFDRHGPRVVFFGRFVSVLRTCAAFLAGTLKMRWRKFLACNALGGITWAAICSFMPCAIGSAIHAISTPADVVLGAVAVAIIIAVILILRRQASKLGKQAEATYPGPLTEH